MLVIKSDECIDCGVCEPGLPNWCYSSGYWKRKWTVVRIEQKVFISLAKHNKKKDPPEDSEKFKDEKNKFEKFFEENIK